jgi:hypothetical protein
LIDIGTKLKRGGGCGGLWLDAINGCIRVLGWTSARMKGLETTGSVEDNPEMTGKWRSEGSGARFWINL